MSEPVARPNSLSAEGEWVNVDAREGAEESEIASGIDKASHGDNDKELHKAQAQAQEMNERFMEMNRRCARAEEAEKRYSELLRKKEEEIVGLAVALKAMTEEKELAVAAAAAAAVASSSHVEDREGAERGMDTLVAQLEDLKERELLWKMSAQSKISYTSFEPGDFALFLPTSNGFFVAFNRGCPFRYLSPESLSAAKAMSGDALPYVLGHVIEIFEQDVIDIGEGNPFNLPVGTRFHICTISVQ